MEKKIKFPSKGETKMTDTIDVEEIVDTTWQKFYEEDYLPVIKYTKPGQIELQLCEELYSDFWWKLRRQLCDQIGGRIWQLIGKQVWEQVCYQLQLQLAKDLKTDKFLPEKQEEKQEINRP